jgi:UDP:flavonoid glycosyltransferase YjiC (YdhE family)
MVRPKEVERPSFIPSDKRVVLVSGSTAYQPGQERILRTTLAAFASDPEVFVIGTDPSGMVQCETPHAIVRPFLPHEDILPFTSHVVCHAGAGLVHRALNFGVPLVVIPLGRDQAEVAARVRNAGVGCVVSSEALDEETLRRALNESDACRGRAQSMAKSFAAARGADVALETLRALVAKRP